MNLTEDKYKANQPYVFFLSAISILYRQSCVIGIIRLENVCMRRISFNRIEHIDILIVKTIHIGRGKSNRTQ